MQFFLSYKCHRLVSLALTRNEEIWSLSTEAAPTMSWIIMVINAISSRLPHDNCPIYKSIAPGKFLKSLPWLEIWLSMVVLVHLPSTYIMHLIGLVHLHLYIFLILHCLFLPCSSQFFFFPWKPHDLSGYFSTSWCMSLFLVHATYPNYLG